MKTVIKFVCVFLAVLFFSATVTVYADVNVDEARSTLQVWVDSHPFQLGSNLEPENDTYIIDGVEYFRFYLSIVRLGVAEILVNQETGAFFHLASPYSSSGFEPLDDWYNKHHSGSQTNATHTDAAQTAYLNEVFYKGIEISRIFDENLDYTLGKPINSRGPYYSYDGLEIYYNDYVDVITITNLSLLEIDGVKLNKTRDELIAAFGNPVEYCEYPGYVYKASDDTRMMRYHVSSYIIDYMLDFWFENTDSKAYSISIKRMGQ